MSETVIETGHSLKSNLEYYGQHLAKVESDIDTLVGVAEIPDEFYAQDMQRLWDIKEQIVQGGSAEDAAEYLDLKYRDQVLNAKIREREPWSYGEQMGLLAHELGEDTLGRLMASEPADGPLHDAFLLNFQETQAKSDVLSSEIKVLKEMYGVDAACDLFGVGGDEFSEAIKEGLATKNGLRWLTLVDKPGEGMEGYDEQRSAERDWMARSLAAFAHIDPAMAREYVFSGVAKNADESLLRTFDAFEHFGPDRIQKISKFTGIYGLERYSLGQLERMEQLVDRPEVVAEELATHDVIVSMINGVGDYNGVLQDIPEKLEDDSARVLFFEINNMTDIYRVMTRINKAGISPSTVVLSAHSGEGQFMVSDYREPSVRRRDVATIAGETLVRMANASPEDPGTRGYSMHGMKGLGRIIESYMAPSRSIDDAPEDIGRKKIIFNACYAAKKTKAHDMDKEGAKYVTGEESVVTQIAKDLSQTGVLSSVDIYGASDGMQVHRTASGLRYSAQPKEIGLGREPLHAVRVRLENGRVQSGQADEIPLRRKAS